MVITGTLCFMTIDRGAPEPLYEQLAAILRRRIQSGELPSRSAIPPLTALQSGYGLSGMTVQHAISLLADEGLIKKVPGRGNFVV